MSVDRYLDALFDRLAGTGAAGRRALAEAEDHLPARRPIRARRRDCPVWTPSSAR